jgi:hypothetical protein
MTQTASLQLEQSVTSRHSVGGKHGPQQPFSVTLFTWPLAQGSGSELQVARAWLQLRSMTQRPKLHVTSSGPIWSAAQRF